MATDYKKASDLIKKVRVIFARGIENRFLLQADVIRLVEDKERIARQEERERCILMAQKYACRNCLNEGICDGTRMCTIKSNIRKAIEEGENNGTES